MAAVAVAVEALTPREKRLLQSIEATNDEVAVAVRRHVSTHDRFGLRRGPTEA